MTIKYIDAVSIRKLSMVLNAVFVDLFCLEPPLPPPKKNEKEL